MLTARHGDQLDTWITASTPTTTDLHSFTTGLKRRSHRRPQWTNSPLSSGAVEGQVNRIKTIKRQMYGRATSTYSAPDCSHHLIHHSGHRITRMCARTPELAPSSPLIWPTVSARTVVGSPVIWPTGSGEAARVSRWLGLARDLAGFRLLSHGPHSSARCSAMRRVGRPCGPGCRLVVGGRGVVVRGGVGCGASGRRSRRAVTCSVMGSSPLHNQLILLRCVCVSWRGAVDSRAVRRSGWR